MCVQVSFDEFDFYACLASMGGAISVRVAAEQAIPSLIGLVVIDVVEGRCLLIIIVMVIHLCEIPNWVFNNNIRRPFSLTIVSC